MSTKSSEFLGNFGTRAPLFKFDIPKKDSISNGGIIFHAMYSAGNTDERAHILISKPFRPLQQRLEPTKTSSVQILRTAKQTLAFSSFRNEQWTKRERP